jgi:hypothetical protein
MVDAGSSSRVLAVLAFLAVLGGYVIPWFRTEAMALILNLKVDFHIWGMSGTSWGMIQATEHTSWFWINLPEEVQSDFAAGGSSFFILAFLCYVLATMVLLAGLIEKGKNLRLASGGLLLVALILFFAGVSQLTASVAWPLDSSWQAGMFLCIGGSVLAIVSGILPTIQPKVEIIEDPRNIANPE